MTQKEPADGGADLHLHTRFSDGTYSVEGLIKAAKQAGLHAIAVTDHDSVGALPRAIMLGEKYGVDIVPGIELSCAHDGSELHILGYCIDFTNMDLKETLRRVQSVRRERMALMIDKLCEAGISIPKDTFFDSVKAESISRLHLAEYLVKKKHVSSIKEVFQKFIGDNRPAHINVNAFGLKEGIEFITANGGVAVYAHPAITRRDDLISEMIGYGLKGIEVFNAAHSEESIRKYREIAEKNGLMVTGGSDCHGLNKAEPLLGKVRMSSTCVDQIRSLRKV
ncbi:MAG: PHP domain-containing protein [Nitrospinota bacterium]